MCSGTCSNLKNVTIVAGVTSIEADAFENCSTLTNVTIATSVTNIGADAFEECSGLTNLTIPGGVASLGRARSRIAQVCPVSRFPAV